MPKNKTDLERWQAAAAAVASDELPASNVPIHVLFGEAVDLSKFCEKHWKTQKEAGKVVRPGLESAVVAKAGAAPSLASTLGADILSLQRAGQEAHTRYLLTVGPKTNAGMLARGRFLLDELIGALEWYFDDGVDDEKDGMLAKLTAAHAEDPNTADALASALDDYAALAEQYRAALDGLGGFDAKHVDEARSVAADLRAMPATPFVMTDDARVAISHRNRLITLLVERMTLVRSAARFVFRKHPEIVREATSTYERRRRAAARRAKERMKGESKEQGPIEGGVDDGDG